MAGARLDAPRLQQQDIHQSERGRIMEAEEVTPTTLAADAAQALQGVTDLIARLRLWKRVWGELPSIPPHSADAPGFTTGMVILNAEEAAAALTALSEQNTALAAQVAELTRERDVLTTAGIVEIASRNNRVTEYMFHWEGRALDAEAKVARLEGALSDPVAVHANMLRGTIAKPTVEQIIHLYGADALRAALTEGTPDE
jgi:hypothetical protein